jgi:hypothetical protein
MAEVWRETPDGWHELVDDETGKVLVREKKHPMKGRHWDAVVPRRESRDRKKAKTEPGAHKYIHDSAGNLVWVPTDVATDALRAKYPLSHATWDVVCRLVMEGNTIKKISQMPGMPPLWVLYQWTQKPELRESWLLAKKARAEAAHDKVFGIADGPAPDKDEAAGVRVQLDAAKWAAEVGDRETFGKSTKITGDLNAPLAILVDTGIQRDPIVLPPEPPKLPEPEQPA